MIIPLPGTGQIVTRVPALWAGAARVLEAGACRQMLKRTAGFPIGKIPCAAYDAGPVRRPVMRHLLQPRVLRMAAMAAFASALASYPRLALWLDRSDPVWYLEGTIFLCTIVLWGFVFSWHTPYTGRPVVTFRQERGVFLAATAVAVLAATVFGLLLDPLLRARIPEEYPADLKHWFAFTLFSLAVNQLFLLFAPFDWLMRLCNNRRVAMSLTVLFSTLMLVIKFHSLPAPFPPLLFAALLAGKVVMGFLAVMFYLRGGVVLIWWWTFLFEARHLLTLPVPG